MVLGPQRDQGYQRSLSNHVVCPLVPAVIRYGPRSVARSIALSSIHLAHSLAQTPLLETSTLLRFLDSHRDHDSSTIAKSSSRRPGRASSLSLIGVPGNTIVLCTVKGYPPIFRQHGFHTDARRNPGARDAHLRRQGPRYHCLKRHLLHRCLRCGSLEIPVPSKGYDSV